MTWRSRPSPRCCARPSASPPSARPSCGSPVRRSPASPATTTPAASTPSSPAATPNAPPAAGGPDPPKEIRVKDSARRRPSPTQRPIDADGLSRDELRRLAKAERKVASADQSVSTTGRREIGDLERRHAERLEGQSLVARLAETSSLALSRGEQVKSETLRIAVPLVDEHGARIVRRGLPLYRQETVTRTRILSRGGLQLAFERGDL